MKPFTTTQIKILTALSDGFSHHDDDLAQTLGVSRTAIERLIQPLIDLGAPIRSHPRQGYRMTTPITLLNECFIRQQLEINHFEKPFHIHLFASLDSTNRYLKELPPSETLEICCAETQTQGRGRFSRHWHSPFGENIYCSTRWHFKCDMSRLSGLSLVVSLAVLSTLETFGFREGIRVKWPNDLLWHDKKLCGSLIEMTSENHDHTEVIIGIGLNVNSTTNDQALPNQAWCSLYNMAGLYFDRNPILVQLIIQLDDYLHRFITSGWQAFQANWRAVDYLQNKMMTLSHPSGTLRGKAIGVNDLGQLILMDEHGETHYFSSGDTTLRTTE